MGNLEGFDANNYEPEGYDPVPAGDYPVVIVASEVRATKAGTGKYLWLEMQITEGKYKGRKIFDNLNIHNPNETAQQIARAKLSSICRAIGVMTPRDSLDLHDKPFDVSIVIEDSQDYGKRNKVKGYQKCMVMPTAASDKLRKELEDAAKPDAPSDEIPF